MSSMELVHVLFSATASETGEVSFVSRIGQEMVQYRAFRTWTVRGRAPLAWYA